MLNKGVFVAASFRAAIRIWYDKRLLCSMQYAIFTAMDKCTKKDAIFPSMDRCTKTATRTITCMITPLT